jgi:hypothetical protein
MGEEERSTRGASRGALLKLKIRKPGATIKKSSRLHFSLCIGHFFDKILSMLDSNFPFDSSIAVPASAAFGLFASVINSVVVTLIVAA